jgi:hypothetical protein
MQRQFSELLLKAASDYGALTTAITDFQWSQSFTDPPSVWGVRNTEFTICKWKNFNYRKIFNKQGVQIAIHLCPI